MCHDMVWILTISHGAMLSLEWDVNKRSGETVEREWGATAIQAEGVEAGPNEYV